MTYDTLAGIYNISEQLDKINIKKKYLIYIHLLATHILSDLQQAKHQQVSQLPQKNLRFPNVFAL